MPGLAPSREGLINLLTYLIFRDQPTLSRILILPYTQFGLLKHVAILSSVKKAYTRRTDLRVTDLVSSSSSVSARISLSYLLLSCW